MKFKTYLLFFAAVVALVGVVSTPTYADEPARYDQPTSAGDLGGRPAVKNPPTSAGDLGGGSGQSTFTLRNPLKGIDSVGGLLSKFIEILSYLLILFAVLMIIWTGLQMILARGNPEGLKEQGKRLGYILIGVALVIGARVIIMVIINTLEATGTVDPRVIQSTNRAIDGR
jgi:hypothetical protein